MHGGTVLSHGIALFFLDPSSKSIICNNFFVNCLLLVIAPPDIKGTSLLRYSNFLTALSLPLQVHIFHFVSSQSLEAIWLTDNRGIQTNITKPNSTNRVNLSNLIMSTSFTFISFIHKSQYLSWHI